MLKLSVMRNEDLWEVAKATVKAHTLTSIEREKVTLTDEQKTENATIRREKLAPLDEKINAIQAQIDSLTFAKSILPNATPEQLAAMDTGKLEKDIAKLKTEYADIQSTLHVSGSIVHEPSTEDIDQARQILTAILPDAMVLNYAAGKLNNYVNAQLKKRGQPEFKLSDTLDDDDDTEE